MAKRVGEAIRRHRKLRGWSQEALAEKADLSLDHVGLIERGSRLPSIGALVRLAQVVGASVDEMIGLDATDPWARDFLRAGAALPESARATVLAMVRGAGQLGKERADGTDRGQ